MFEEDFAAAACHKQCGMVEHEVCTLGAAHEIRFVAERAVGEVNPVAGRVDDDAGLDLDATSSELIGQRYSARRTRAGLLARHRKLVRDAGPVILGLAQQIDDEALRAFYLGVLVLRNVPGVGPQFRECAPHGLATHQERVALEAGGFPRRPRIRIVEHKPSFDHEGTALGRSTLVILDEEAQRSVHDARESCPQRHEGW